MKILYVEDDPGDVQLVRCALDGVHQLENAPTLAAAMARLDQPGDFDLVLVDLLLPDGSGMELSAYVRDHGLPLAVVILTGKGGQETAADAVNFGVDDYIIKKNAYLKNLPMRLTAALQHHIEAPKLKPKTLRLLYVEDNAMDVDLTRRHLAQSAPHIQVETLPSIEKLLDRLTGPEQTAAVCDILLLDYNLPGFNAMEAMKLLRLQHKVEVPTLLVTSQGSEEVAAQALRLGFDSYLIKQPGYLHQLPGMLEGAFYRAELAREHANTKALQEQYMGLVTRIPVGVFRLRLPQADVMAFEYASPRFCEIFALPPDSCLANVGNIFSLMQPDDLAKFMGCIDASRRSLEPMEWEGRFIINGETRWVRLDSFFTRLDNGDIVSEGILKDITEHKRMELDLAKSEARFSGAMGSTRDAFVIMDAGQGTVVEWNPAAETIFGYRREEMIGQKLHDFITPPRYREAAQRGLEHFVSSGEGPCIGKTLELTALRKNGEEFPVELSLSAMRLGDEWYATGVARDISERNANEDSIRKLSLAVEQSPESIVITNLDAAIEYVNEAFVRVTGYGREEVTGKNPRFLQTGKTPPENYVSLWDALTNGRAWEGEFINRRKDGSEFTEFASISPIRQLDGRITHYLAIKEDVTEARRAENAISESKMLLQRVIDSTPDWIYVKDSEHRFMLVNRSFAYAFGQTPDCMIGRYDTDFMQLDMSDGGSGEGMQRLHDDDDAVFGGQSIHNPCDKLCFESGEIRFFDTFKGPLRDAAQKIYGNLCYRRDITERFKTEQEQKVLEKQLLQAQKMELIGQLTGGIAHDFNNILASMFGYAELIQMSSVIKQDAQLSLYLQEILQAGIRAKELVAQLLTFSRKSETASEAIFVAPIVKEVSKLLRSTMPTSITIDTSIAKSLPEVLISPVQLHQVLMNLGINARDAISGNGVVEIRAKQIELDGSTTCASCHRNISGQYLMISVRDSGSGIPPENLLKIFDPFFTTKEVGQGSGLGLSVLHGIVHSANGHIDVFSELGKGTEFRIYLPIQSRQAELPVREVRPDSGKVAVSGHVMVVDDEASIVGFITVQLENLGCKVSGLTSAAEALRIFRNDPYGVDMVITDQSMPDMTGAELARAMIECRPDIPIVMNTGYSNEINEEMARQIGIRRFLIKPVSAKVFADVVGECLAVRGEG